VVQAAYDVQQRRLPAAGWREQDNDFSGGNVEVEAALRAHLSTSPEASVLVRARAAKMVSDINHNS